MYRILYLIKTLFNF